MSGAVVKWRGGLAKTMGRQAAYQGLLDAAEHLRGVSQQAAPVDEGILRATAQVTPGPGEQVAVSYDTPYACRQHEELGWRHPKGGQAKYLEGPAHEEDATMRRIVRTAIKQAGF